MSELLISPQFMALIALFVITIILSIFIWRMHKKMQKFLIDVDSENINDSLSHVTTSLADLQKFRSDMEIYLDTVEKRLKKSVQSVHTVRFNPFKGTGGGGNQSFATALLNEKGDGVVISSLYSREHVSVFAKPVKNHISEHEMSLEENEALSQAEKDLK